MLNKHSSFYRILVIIVAFALLGIAIFLPLLSTDDKNYVLIFILLGVYALAMVAAVVITEIYWRTRKK